MPTSPLRDRARSPKELGASFLPYFGSYFWALRNPPTLVQARVGLAQRRARQVPRFLAALRQEVFARPAQPYTRLFAAAGCSYGDVEQLVTREGLSGALRELLRQGIYLTEPELKGRRPVVRGSLSFQMSFGDLRRAGQLVRLADGRRRWRYSEMFRETAENSLLSLEAVGGLAWRHAYWGTVADTSLLWFVRFSGAGSRPARWFVRLDPASPQMPRSGRLLARFLPGLARLAGGSIPTPTHVPRNRPDLIVRWLLAERSAGQTAHFYGHVSAALVLVERAGELGFTLSGVQMSVAGEPLTASRRRTLETAGARVRPMFGTKEAGLLAHGCGQPQHVDDLHLYDDSFALLQRDARQTIDDHPADAVYLTTLQPGWPYLLINGSLADRAQFAADPCGCPLEALGWRTRLHSLRSFARLKLASLRVPGDLLLPLVERQLPAWFGGHAGSYQLVEDDAQSDGHARIRLRVPETVAADDDLIRRRILVELTRLGVPYKETWTDPAWLVVERGRPVPTPGGKTYPLYALEAEGAATPDGL